MWTPKLARALATARIFRAQSEREPGRSSAGNPCDWRQLCTLLCLCTGAVIASGAQTFTTLASFDGPNGAFSSSILQGADGKLWGTTSEGGSSNCGKVFKLTVAGSLTGVTSFNCAKGKEPGGLILGSDGNFYGTTFFGSPGNGGTVFKLSPKGVLTVLLNFSLDGIGGSGPVGLVEGADGDFYGATYSGGSSLSYGTVFKISPSGALTTLYQFDFTHGAQPYAGPIQGADGNFYGTTYSGGVYGGGTVYRITPKGALTVLHSFGEFADDPSSPVNNLVQGKDGNFYGATPYGGPNNDGSVFKITPSGVLTILHNFAETDGRSPGSLMQATDGNFYGTTAYGGANDPDGTIFKMTSTGAVTTLHSFNGTDGAQPSMLIQDTNGDLFGMTGGGGDLNCDPTYGCGTIFTLAVGLGPFVETVPTRGSVGTNVTILGTNLATATAVSFGGTAAKFTIVSSSEITTTVPMGATISKIKVTTASLVLLSNTFFRVTK